MTIQYKYIKAGKIHCGEIPSTETATGHHEIVRAVVQHIANEAGETIVFSMLDPTGTARIGTDHAEPEGVEDTGQRTIETIEVSEDGETWNSLDIRF